MASAPGPAAVLALVLGLGAGLGGVARGQEPARLSEADFRSGTTGDLADLCGAAPGDPLYAAGIG